MPGSSVGEGGLPDVVNDDDDGYSEGKHLGANFSKFVAPLWDWDSAHFAGSARLPFLVLWVDSAKSAKVTRDDFCRPSSSKGPKELLVGTGLRAARLTAHTGPLAGAGPLIERNPGGHCG